MHECSVVDASIAGEYAPDRYIMWIHTTLEEGVPEPWVVLHEYWHYLQNLTTLHGVRSFLASQQLLARFSATMNADGTSRGSDGLPLEMKLEIERFAQLRTTREGEIGVEYRGKVDVLAKAVRAQGAEVVFDVRRGHSVREYSLILGARAIKESIAHIVEREVRGLSDGGHPRVPEFPYAVLERVAEMVVGHRCEALVVACAGTLALLTPDPGPAVLGILARFREERASHESDFAALRAIATAAVLPALRVAHELLVQSDLPSVIGVHRGRGGSEKAVAYLAGEVERGLRRRLADPWFDLRPLLEQGPGHDPVNEMIELMSKDFVPCDMIVAGSVRSFHPPVADEAGMDLSQYLHAFQSQQEFMFAHLRDGVFVPTTTFVYRCSYFDACTHPTRTEHESNCRTAPWKNYGAARAGCWFTSGVAATIGPGQLRKV